MTWVISNIETGESTEDMRHATYHDAEVWIDEHTDPDRGVQFDMRWESGEPHPENYVALGQLWSEGKWHDYARSTPDAAIRWAKGQPVALARVVDWVGREVMWP